MNKSFSSYTDNELLSLLRESNLDAYREVYDRYHARLYIHALKRLKIRRNAEILFRTSLSIFGKNVQN